MSEEHREGFRLEFTPEAVCRPAGGQSIKGTLTDISKDGCFLETATSPAVLGKCLLEIVIQANYSLLNISNIEGEIVRSDDKGVAIKFDHAFEWIPLVPLCEPKVKSWKI